MQDKSTFIFISVTITHNLNKICILSIYLQSYVIKKKTIISMMLRILCMIKFVNYAFA